MLADGVSGDGADLALDPDGAKWAGVLLFNKADLEKLVHLGRPSYGGGGQICGECLADRADLAFTDARLDSNWRPTEAAMTNDVYVHRHSQNGHPMGSSPFLCNCFTDLTRCTCMTITA